MSDLYEHEIVLEEPGEPSERPKIGVAGMAVGVVIVVLIGVGLWVGSQAASDWLSRLPGFGDRADVTAEVVPGRQVVVEIPPGASARQIGILLAENAVVASSADFESAVRNRGVGARLKAGGYEFVGGMSLDEIIDILIEGPNQATFRITVTEGRRIGEVLDDLARQSEFTREQFSTALLSGSVASVYLPGSASGIQAWEGLLFPDTYEFFPDATPAEILQRMANELERNVGDLRWDGFRERGFTIYEGIVMASMIEAEAGVDEDRPLIASVLFNRLDEGMLLQIDATVLYALGQRRTGLTLEDLEIDSLYNTYAVEGLPPTPIGAPGFRSLQAVTAPAETDFRFYVLSASDGSHTFTETYEEFLVAKEQAREDGLLP